MKLQKLLFEPTLVRSVPKVVQWWESRRLAYNLVVGVVGLGTLAVGVTLSLISPRQFGGGPPWQLPIVYGILANVFYTFGWVTEIAVEKWLGKPAFGLGPALFRYGLVFSIGLTGLPAIMMIGAAILGAIFR